MKEPYYSIINSQLFIMLTQATSFFRNAVRSIEDRHIVGRVNNLVVDPENGKILAFTLESFLSKLKVISPSDVIGYSPGIIIIRNREQILPIREIVRAHNVWKKKIDLLSCTCKTESGKYLGEIDDYLIDLDDMRIIKYYVRGSSFFSPFAPNRIILASKTIKIKRGVVIVQDEEEQMKDFAAAKTSTINKTTSSAVKATSDVASKATQTVKEATK